MSGGGRIASPGRWVGRRCEGGGDAGQSGGEEGEGAEIGVREKMMRVRLEGIAKCHVWDGAEGAARLGATSRNTACGGRDRCCSYWISVQRQGHSGATTNRPQAQMRTQEAREKAGAGQARDQSRPLCADAVAREAEFED